MNGDRENNDSGPLRQENSADGIPVVPGQAPACPGKIKVPTDGELEALRAMRSIKEQSRRLKKRLASLEALDEGEKTGQISGMREELERLKGEWNRWEEKRAAAARERMIILGHEEGPP